MSARVAFHVHPMPKIHQGFQNSVPSSQGLFPAYANHCLITCRYHTCICQSTWWSYSSMLYIRFWNPHQRSLAYLTQDAPRHNIKSNVYNYMYAHVRNSIHVCNFITWHTSNTLNGVATSCATDKSIWCTHTTCATTTKSTVENLSRRTPKHLVLISLFESFLERVNRVEEFTYVFNSI